MYNVLLITYTFSLTALNRSSLRPTRRESISHPPLAPRGSLPKQVVNFEPPIIVNYFRRSIDMQTSVNDLACSSTPPARRPALAVRRPATARNVAKTSILPVKHRVALRQRTEITICSRRRFGYRGQTPRAATVHPEALDHCKPIRVVTFQTHTVSG